MSTESKVLIYINENPGVTSSDLVKTLCLSKSTVSLYLKKLELDNLIVKYFENNKKILYKLHPTKKGKDFYLKEKFATM